MGQAVQAGTAWPACAPLFPTLPCWAGRTFSRWVAAASRQCHAYVVVEDVTVRSKLTAAVRLLCRLSTRPPRVFRLPQKLSPQLLQRLLLLRLKDRDQATFDAPAR